MATTNAFDVKQLESWARDAMSARENLRALFDCLIQGEESLQGWATEALENCGAPKTSDLGFLQEQVGASSSTDVAYWSATLLGRLGVEASPALPVLCEVVQSEKTEIQVRIKAAWALGKIGVANSQSQTALKKASSSSNARLAQIAADSLKILR